MKFILLKALKSLKSKKEYPKMSAWAAMAEELKRQNAEEAAAGKNDVEPPRPPPTKKTEPDAISVRSNTSKKPSLWDRVRGRKNEQEASNTKQRLRSTTPSMAGTKKPSLWDNLDFGGGTNDPKSNINSNSGTPGAKKPSLWDNLDFGGGANDPKSNINSSSNRNSGWGSITQEDLMKLRALKNDGYWSGITSEDIMKLKNMDSGSNRNSGWGSSTQEDLMKLRSLKTGGYWSGITDDDIKKLRGTSQWDNITEEDLIRLKKLKNESFWDKLTSDDIRRLKEPETEHRFQKLSTNAPMGTFISQTMPSVLTNFEPPLFCYPNFPTPNVNPVTNYEVHEFKRKYPLVHTVVFSTPPVNYR